MIKRSNNIVRIASVFEAAKGSIVLLTGFGLLVFIHKDLHLASEQIVRHLHLNPASHHPMIFIEVINSLTDLQLLALALSAFIYSLVRFIEAYGLWYHRPWAEWFGLLTGGMYIPVELYELTQGMTMIKLTILAVNMVIVAVLANALHQSRE